MPISSVNLDEETQAISKRVGNFSEIVRECLRRWNAYENGTHIQPEAEKKGRKCYPRAKKGCCVICWHHGGPLDDDWKYYVAQLKTHPTSATAFIERAAAEENISTDFPIPKQSNFHKSRDIQKIGLYARFKRFFRLG